MATPRVRHGMTGSPEYIVWKSIRQRCLNRNHDAYPWYGGRGISIDPRWDNFLNFLEDMGYRPDLSFSIDRLDPNGNYCKDNCRWATRRTQNRNRRNNVRLAVNGIAQVQQDWAEERGVAASVIQRRLRRGWTVEDAVNAPLNTCLLVGGPGHNDLMGAEFERFTVVGGPDRRGNKKSIYWFCRCVCGTEKWVRADHITRHKIRSCGCL